MQQPAHHVLPVFAARCSALIRHLAPSFPVLGAAEAADETAREGAYAVAALQPRALLHQLIRLLAVFWYALPAVSQQPGQVCARRQMPERNGAGELLDGGDEIAGSRETLGVVGARLSLEQRVTRG